MGDHGGDGVTRSGLRYRLLSPTSSVVEEDKVIVNNKFSILPSSIAAPLIWDMDGGSGTMNGPRRYSGAVGTIELEDFIQKFDSWCDMQMLRNARLFSPFLAWKGLFQHLEGLPMDDYHEFRRDHAAEIKEWRQHWSPSYVSITHNGVASGGTTTPSTPSTSTQVVPPPPFNLVTEFFLRLKKNYQGVKTEKLKSLQEFERKTSESLRKAYIRMQRLIIVTQGVMEAQAIQFCYGILDKELQRRVRDVTLMNDDSPTLAHVFALSEKIKLNMVEERVVTSGFSREEKLLIFMDNSPPHNLVVVVVGVVEVRYDPSQVPEG